MLCFLSLIDKYYYQIKELTKSNKKEIFNIIKCVKIKLIIFFVFTLIIFIFYMYLVTAFCAVYENTQIAYIKDSFISFVIGLLESFIIYAFTSSLRVIALKCSHRNLKFIYKLSEIIPIF